MSRLSLASSGRRPVQVLYIALMYEFFGFNPLGYHTVNIVMIALAAVAFYLCLRELELSRSVALASPLLYALLPHYSVSRFWVSASQTNLHLALMFVSFYSLLRACRREPGAFAWMALSCLAMWLSILAYEVAVPLFIVAALFALYRTRAQKRGSPRMAFAIFALYCLSFGCVVALKAGSSSRVSVRGMTVHRIVSSGTRRLLDLDPAVNAYGLNIRQAIGVNFGTFGVGMPRIAWESASLGRGLLAGSLLIFGAVSFYLFTSLRITDWPAIPFWWRIIGSGFVMFAAGYSIFLVTSDIQFTPTGIGNRTSIAATIGVGLVFTGCAGLLSSSVHSGPGRILAFSIMVGLISAASFAVVSRVALDWEKAWTLQRSVLYDIRARFPGLPPGTTLILDGVCPYVGPAIVFENSADLAGALQILYRDPTLKADVVTPRLRFDASGVTSAMYDSEAHYRYGSSLLLFNRMEKLVVSLAEVATAERYFKRWNPTGCPPAHEGLGVKIF